MPDWTLTHDATTQSLEAWGLENVVVTRHSFAPGTLQMSLVADFDAPALFAYGDRVTLRGPDDVVRFTGRIRQRPARIGGSEEGRDYIAEDVLGDLARRTFTQSWRVWGGEALIAIPLPSLVLFRDIDAGAVTIAAQLTAVITAAAAAGIEVQMGSSAGMTANPQAVDAAPMTYLDALRICARFAPDLCTQVNHATEPPTINFVRRVNATERSLAIIDTADAFTCDALEDQRITGVHISYNRALNVSGLSLRETIVDKHPAETTGAEENSLVVVHELRGASPPTNVTQTQELETVDIEPDSFDWWELVWPELVGRNEAATLTDDDIEGPGGVTKQITNGAQPAWIGSAATVLVTATFNGIINGRVYVGKKLIARVNASTLASGTYQTIKNGTQYDPGETTPTGFASLLYGALNPLQFVGTHKRATAELDWTIDVGDALNFTGTDDASLTTARASVQSVARRIDSAEQTISFGPSPAYSFNDLIDLMRAQRVHSSARAEERAGEGTGTSVEVEGAGMGPGCSLVPTPDPETHPFKVGHVGGNTFRIEGGSYNGVPIAAETTDIGADRPRYVYIAVQWTVAAWQDRFAASVERTGAPAFASSTSPVSTDVVLPPGATTAKHLLAVINAGNTITQTVTTNLLPQWRDNGSLAGEAALVSA